MKLAVLTISDRCSRGEMTDEAGPALARMAQEKLGATVVATACVPDDQAQIVDHLRRWSTQADSPDVILTTGGTGLGPRDVTPEATASVLERRHPALLELARLRCYARTPRAFLSRGEAGTIARSLIINLPGSTRGATEMLDALVDLLPHAVHMLRGESGDH